jgi:uncharacterized protein
MLSYNVTDLLRAAPGTSQVVRIDTEQFVVADDLSVAAPVQGTVRLANTGRGILARGHLTTAFAQTCSRCLVDTLTPVELDFTEEALPSVDLESGEALVHEEDPEILLLDEHHELDLTATVRDAISLAEPIVVLCRPDCLGLCLTCGIDLNADAAHTHGEDELDPRLAALVAIREQLRPLV